MKAESPVVYIMGVAGSGKTTVGQKLSVATGIPFFDADDFHSTANKEKMKDGHPLNDADRKDWLERINELAKEHSQKKGAIIACSALKQQYRIILSEGIKPPVHWVLLHGNFGLIQERIKSRKNHFMPANLLQSQFDTLELPVDAMVMDIRDNPDQIVDDILRKTELTRGQTS
ncbi:MAG: gluconokinase [Chitinophagaceae bacterium]